jgi:hypothetical protein
MIIMPEEPRLIPLTDCIAERYKPITVERGSYEEHNEQRDGKHHCSSSGGKSSASSQPASQRATKNDNYAKRAFRVNAQPEALVLRQLAAGGYLFRFPTAKK